MHTMWMIKNNSSKTTGTPYSVLTFDLSEGWWEHSFALLLLLLLLCCVACPHITPLMGTGPLGSQCVQVDIGQGPVSAAVVIEEAAGRCINISGISGAIIPC